MKKEEGQNRISRRKNITQIINLYYIELEFPVSLIFTQSLIIFLLSFFFLLIHLLVELMK